MGVPLYGHILPLLPLARAFRDRGDAVAVAVPPSLVHLFADEDLRVFPTGPEPSDIQAEVLLRTGVDVTDQPSEASEAKADAEAEAFTGSRIDLTITDVLTVAHEWRPDLLVGDTYDYVSLVAAAILDLPVIHVTTGTEVNPSFEQRMRAKAAQWCAARGLAISATQVAAGHLAARPASRRLAATSRMDTDEPGGPGRSPWRPPWRRRPARTIPTHRAGDVRHHLR